MYLVIGCPTRHAQAPLGEQITVSLKGGGR